MPTFRWITEHLEERLGACLLAGMACLAFTNVITCYVFQYPLAFTEELEVNALVWLTRFGTSSAFRRRRHLAMIFFQDKLSKAAEPHLFMIPYGYKCLDCIPNFRAKNRFCFLVFYDSFSGVRH